MGSGVSASSGARALANYPNPRQVCYPPTCSLMDDMDEGEKDRVNSFITYHFKSSIQDMVIGGRLWPLADTLLASFLKDAEVMRETYGINEVLAKVDEAARATGILTSK